MKTLSAAYRCEFCRKLYELKPSAEKHESICRLNPANWRPCHDCQHLTKRKYEVSGQGEDGISHTVELLFCNKLESFTYPPNKAAKAKKHESDDNIPMPTQCKFQEKAWNYELDPSADLTLPFG